MADYVIMPQTTDPKAFTLWLFTEVANPNPGLEVTPFWEVLGREPCYVQRGRGLQPASP